MNGETFSSSKEEIGYWKNLAQDYKRSYVDAKEELDEFQSSSRELEAELEAQLEQAESKSRELTAQNSRLQMEVDLLREKLEEQQTCTHKQITELEDDLAQVSAFRDELQKYIRGLEQANDDLERAKRATVVSLEDFEGRLNMAIERNAFLESELEDREAMSVTVQRLKDEARDLRQEIDVKTVKDNNDSVKKMPSLDKVDSKIPKPGHIVDSNKLVEENNIPPVSTPTKVVPPASLNLSHNGTGTGTPLTPSARISALNIVGDLLRKVGALESKLASCRNFVKDQPRNNRIGATSPVNSPRAKRLHRGSASGASAPATSSKQVGYVKIAV